METQPSNNESQSLDDIDYKKGIQQGWWEDYPRSVESTFYWAWAENYFKKLKLKVVTTKTTEKDNLYALRHGQKQLDDHDEENLRYIALVDSGDSATSHQSENDRFIAVFDSLNPTRAFVGETVQEGEQYGSVVGAICYFDEKSGGVASIRPFSHVLFPPVWDDRESVPKWDSVYLCGQKLVFFSYRTCGRGQLQLKGFCMNNKERIVASFKHITSMFGGDYPEHMYYDNPRPEEKCKQHGRWLCFQSNTAKKHICLDMKSIRRGERTEEKDTTYWDDDRENYRSDGTTTERTTILCDQVEFSDSLDPKQVLATLTEVPFYGTADWDGYPTNCIKCGGTTVWGSIFFGGMLAGLGRAVCLNCKIRYSKSKQNWLCWNGIESENDKIRECFGTVNAPNYICQQPHVHSNKIKIEQCKVLAGESQNDFHQDEVRIGEAFRKF